MTILKAQMPLSGNHPDPGILLYDQARTINRMVPITSAWQAMFEGRPKIYVKATVHRSGRIEVHRRVKDQPW